MNLLLLYEALAPLSFRRLKDLRLSWTLRWNWVVTLKLQPTCCKPQQQMESYIGLLTVFHLEASLCGFRSYTYKEQFNRWFYCLFFVLTYFFILSTVKTCAVWSRSSEMNHPFYRKYITPITCCAGQWSSSPTTVYNYALISQSSHKCGGVVFKTPQWIKYRSS